MSTGVSNYYGASPLNRLSYLRQSPAFLASCLSSPKAKFVIYSGLNPLFNAPASDGAWTLRFLSWDDVKASLGGDAADYVKLHEGKDEKLLSIVPGVKEGEDLTKEEKIKKYITQSNLVFLGVDERSAPESAKSLPLSKPDAQSSLESHSPHGEPYWALDVSLFTDLKEKAVGLADRLEFRDLRTGMAFLGGEHAAISGQGRALLDWNQRNVFCQGCGRPMISIWGGWKRVCVPAEGFDANPPCPSKGRGVQNYNYPRTDPVVIMAITSPDRESILLGRQKVWPAKMYSCLAGFLEFGETVEEAVRREVYEEAGIDVGDVYYHSSQPWPYPSSLMIGAIGVAKPGQTIRLDLDNELEDARYFSRAEVLEILNGTHKALTKEEMARFDVNQEVKEIKTVVEDGPAFRLPSGTAIAHTLIEAWARNTYLGSGKL